MPLPHLYILLAGVNIGHQQSLMQTPSSLSKHTVIVIEVSTNKWKCNASSHLGLDFSPLLYFLSYVLSVIYIKPICWKQKNCFTWLAVFKPTAFLECLNVPLRNHKVNTITWWLNRVLALSESVQSAELWQPVTWLKATFYGIRPGSFIARKAYWWLFVQPSRVDSIKSHKYKNRSPVSAYESRSQQLSLCYTYFPTRWRTAVVFPASLMWGVQVGQRLCSNKTVWDVLYLTSLELNSCQWI